MRRLPFIQWWWLCCAVILTSAAASAKDSTVVGPGPYPNSSLVRFDPSAAVHPQDVVDLYRGKHRLGQVIVLTVNAARNEAVVVPRQPFEGTVQAGDRVAFKSAMDAPVSGPLLVIDKAEHISNRGLGMQRHVDTVGTELDGSVTVRNVGTAPATDVTVLVYCNQGNTQKTLSVVPAGQTARVEWSLLFNIHQSKSGPVQVEVQYKVDGEPRTVTAHSQLTQPQDTPPPGGSPPGY